MTSPAIAHCQPASGPRPTSIWAAPRHIAAVLLLSAAPLSAVAALNGVVTVADGEPFTIIRGDKLLTATKGVAVGAGDFIETQTGNFVVAELPDGSIVALGPSTRVYLIERADIPTFVLMRGWLKLDAHPAGKGRAHNAVSSRLGASTPQGVLILHAGDREDEAFHESGTMTLLIHDRGGRLSARETKVNQFFVGEDRTVATSAPRPSAAFVAAMPVPFRDPLPDGLAKGPKFRPAEPKYVREVSYSDVSGWLTISREWRSGFVERFRGRLKDPAFFAAMDARLPLHPEWTAILHPPPPPPAENTTPPGGQPAAALK